MLARIATGVVVALAVAIAPGCGDSEDPPAPPRIDPSLFEYDRGRPLAASIEPRGRRHGLRVADVSFRSFDGRRVEALLAHPEGANACIIFQGGYGGAKEGATAVWGLMAAERAATFSIDSRLRGPRIARDPRRLYEALRRTVIDLRRALDYLEQRPECDPARLGYVGASMGGFAGTMLAAVDRRVAAAALIVTGGDWRLVLEGTDQLLPGIERRPESFLRALRLLGALDPARWVGHISPRPVLMINGESDQVVVPAAARALWQAAREPKRIVTYEGGHAQFLGPGHRDDAQLLADWVREHVVER